MIEDTFTSTEEESPALTLEMLAELSKQFSVSGYEIIQSEHLMTKRRRLVRLSWVERIFRLTERPYFKKKKWQWWPCARFKIEKYDAPARHALVTKRFSIFGNEQSIVIVHPETYKKLFGLEGQAPDKENP